VNTAIVPATTAHALELSLTMRQADRDEVIAQSGVHPGLAIGMSLGNSVKAWTGLADGKVACIWGVSADDDDAEVGIPWMLGTDLIAQHSVRFLIESRGALDEMQAMFPILRNHVDERNKAAIKWLRWLGFKIFPTVPFGPYNMPFHPFSRERE